MTTSSTTIPPPPPPLLPQRPSSSSSQQPEQQLQPRRRRRRRLLIIAAVPKDERHIYTLWTQLECFTTTVDTVILSVPDWSYDIIEPVVQLAKQSIPHFITHQSSLMVQYTINDRYDVGLWCDALQLLQYHQENNSSNNSHSLMKDDYDEIGLINDSVFALRSFSTIFDVLTTQRNNNNNTTTRLVSLSYSYSSKYFQHYGSEHYWVESIFRTFDIQGLEMFQNYSCSFKADHAVFCPTKPRWKRKDCVVNYFEHDLAAQYLQNNNNNTTTTNHDDNYSNKAVYGMYPTDVFKANGQVSTWAIHDDHWRDVLVQQLGFPIAKANRPKNVIPNIQTDPLLQNCTRYLQPNRSALAALNLNFSLAQDGLTPQKSRAKKLRQGSSPPKRTT